MLVMQGVLAYKLTKTRNLLAYKLTRESMRGLLAYKLIRGSERGVLEDWADRTGYDYRTATDSSRFSICTGSISSAGLNLKMRE
jgi:hypothetical protein